VKIDTEQTAQAEMISYLAQRYKVNEIFTDTKTFDNSHVYKAKQLVLYSDSKLYYVNIPVAEYDKTVTYTAGNQVFFNDSVYTCLFNIKAIDPTYSQYWGTGIPYSVTAVLPTDVTKWTLGDNRNPLIVQYLLDITLYHLHSRINPRNIPDLRKERYNGNDPMDRGGAIGWLKKVASSDLTADLPTIDPSQGVSIRWGNANGITIRNSNTY
jgi:hypothetical protein